jgi:aspartyl-tRNA(Asn)/glutamyl-tRNA(Gln) amidotransferase subunit C
MKITRETVLHVAELARLEFQENELDKFREQLENILGYIENLNKLGTSSVEPTYHVLEISTPLRRDIVEPWLSVDEALENSPDREHDFFAVPKVIEG